MTKPAVPIPGRVSVIIPTYNGRDLALTCLRSLQRQRYPLVEIIVVDNGSSDGTLDAVRREFPTVRCVANAVNLGFVGGCHRGADAATGEYLLFLNNDTVQDPDFITALVAAIREDPQIGICASKVLLQQAPRYLDAVGAVMTGCGFLSHLGLYEPDTGQYDRLRYIFSPKGVSFLMPAEEFERLRRFDETFFAYFEESDLAWRVWLVGKTVVFVPASIVYHTSTATAARLHPEFVNFHVYKNRIRTLLKNFGGLRLIKVLPVHLAMCGAIAGLHLVRGRGRSAWAIVRAVGWNVAHLPDTMAQRRHVQRELRRCSDRALFAKAYAPTSWRDFLRLYRLYMNFWERRQAPVSAESTSCP